MNKHGNICDITPPYRYKGFLNREIDPEDDIAVFAETLEGLEQMMRLILESRSYTI
jgi:hypothetical protein